MRQTFVFLLTIPLILSARPAGIPAHARFLEKQGIYVADEKDRQDWYYASGQLRARGPWDGKVKTGEWTFFHENGKKSAFGRYESDRKEGRWQYFHKTGEVAEEGEYKSGNRTGHWIRLFPSGKKEAEGDYKENQKHGAWISYYENGQVFSRGSYNDGKAEGKWEYFFEQGKLHQSGEYRNDVRVGVWMVCIFAAGPCGNEDYHRPKSPRISGLPSADEKKPAKNPKDPGAILDSLDKGVPQD